jgi:succinylglutamate desuccinylase
MINQLEAWSKGRRTMITIENPNPNETNKRYIRQEGNIVFGPWKRTMEGSK